MTGPAIIAVLLAGGQARRMGGGDKCLLHLGQQTLLARAIARVRPQASHVMLSANGDPGRFDNYNLEVVADPISDAGPLAGVLAGLEWAAHHHGPACHIVTVPTDTPFFPGDLVARLVAAAATDNTPLACAASDGRAHPVFGLWPAALAGDLRAALVKEGVRKVEAWTQRHGLALAHFDTGAGDPFFNINRPDDLAMAENRLREVAL
ncbi:MAG: molybdenum cofactor guanylyltransferase MobA [Alphaproteobacteria bacterium]